MTDQSSAERLAQVAQALRAAALIRSNPFWYRRANDETRRHK